MTITTVSTGAFSNGLITMRSSATPPANAIATVAAKAPQKGQPCPSRVQQMKVENIAISPCAKLTTRVAR